LALIYFYFSVSVPFPSSTTKSRKMNRF
jgi:hypothetical protein